MHPIAFQWGSFTVHWYGIMMATAFVAGLWTASRRGLREGLPPDRILDLGPWLIGGAILGARIVYVTTYWQDSFAGHSIWEIFEIWNGGLVFYGGLLGATLSAMLYVRLKQLPLWKVADTVAPSISLGYVFGRIGCFLNGCCWGKICNLPWAVSFPNGSFAWQQQYDAGLVGRASRALPVHPTEIYDALLNLATYLALAWLFRRKKFDGQVFAAYLMCYAVTRSLVESFRGDYTPPHLHDGLTPAQLIGIGTFAAGAALFWFRQRFQVRHA